MLLIRSFVSQRNTSHRATGCFYDFFNVSIFDLMDLFVFVFSAFTNNNIYIIIFIKSIINWKISNLQNNYIKLGNILYTKNWLCLHRRVRETLYDNLPPDPADHETPVPQGCSLGLWIYFSHKNYLFLKIFRYRFRLL